MRTRQMMNGQTCPTCGRPRLLDAYSGRGGCGKGYQRAGFCVSAVDTNGEALANYPLDCAGAVAVKGDAIAFILEHGRTFAVRHASPPCTGYSQATSMLAGREAKYDRLIAATRAALLEVGGPYVIENVTSKLTWAELIDPIQLCWTMFREPGDVIDADGTALWMRRHRLFESNVALSAPGPHRHPKAMQCAGAYGGARRDKIEARHVRKGGYVPTADVQARLLGIDWMNAEAGLFLAIPPAYTEHLGTELMHEWLLDRRVARRTA